MNKNGRRCSARSRSRRLLEERGGVVGVDNTGVQHQQQQEQNHYGMSNTGHCDNHAGNNNSNNHVDEWDDDTKAVVKMRRVSCSGNGNGNGGGDGGANALAALAMAGTSVPPSPLTRESRFSGCERSRSASPVWGAMVMTATATTTVTSRGWKTTARSGDVSSGRVGSGPDTYILALHTAGDGDAFFFERGEGGNVLKRNMYKNKQKGKVRTMGTSINVR